MILIETIITGDVYPGTWILHNNEKKEIIRVNEKTVVVQDKEGEKRISRDEIKDSILKYSVKVNKKIFDVIYSDYHIAIRYNNGDFVDGYTTMIKSRAKTGQTARIDDLYTVDKFKLYDFNERFATIISQEGAFFTLELTRANKGSIKLHRTKFSLINEKDNRILFKLNCKCS